MDLLRRRALGKEGSLTLPSLTTHPSPPPDPAAKPGLFIKKSANAQTGSVVFFFYLQGCRMKGVPLVASSGGWDRGFLRGKGL